MDGRSHRTSVVAIGLVQVPVDLGWTRAFGKVRCFGVPSSTRCEFSATLAQLCCLVLVPGSFGCAVGTFVSVFENPSDSREERDPAFDWGAERPDGRGMHQFVECLEH